MLLPFPAQLEMAVAVAASTLLQAEFLYVSGCIILKFSFNSSHLQSEGLEGEGTGRKKKDYAHKHKKVWAVFAEQCAGSLLKGRLIKK